MNITNKKIEELKPYKNNPRNNDKAVDKVAESIKEFGFKVPMVIDKNNEIITGHTRLKAAIKLGLKEVPCIIADDLNEEQIKAFRLIDNKVSEFSTWDESLLAKELDDLVGSSFKGDMNSFGFETLDNIKEDELYMEQEVQRIQKEQMENIDKDTEEANKKIKQGDMFKLGDHILMCGDSTLKDHITKLIGKRDIKLLLTDPPYGISVVKSKNSNLTQTNSTCNKGSLGVSNKPQFNSSNKKSGLVGGGGIVKANAYKPVANDENTEIFKKCWEIIKDYTFNKIIWGGNYFLDFLPFQSNLIVWKKKADNTSRNNFSDGEVAWCNFKTQCNIFSYSPIKVYDLKWNGINKYKGWTKHEDIFSRFHPTQKPVKLSADILYTFTNKDDYILDLFGGSGSALIAAEQTKRKMLMMEYDPYYVDKIIKRWETFTGKKAEKIEEDK